MSLNIDKKHKVNDNMHSVRMGYYNFEAKVVCCIVSQEDHFLYAGSLIMVLI